METQLDTFPALSGFVWIYLDATRSLQKQIWSFRLHWLGWSRESIKVWQVWQVGWANNLKPACRIPLCTGRSLEEWPWRPMEILLRWCALHQTSYDWGFCSQIMRQEELPQGRRPRASGDLTHRNPKSWHNHQLMLYLDNNATNLHLFHWCTALHCIIYI